jgi:hypothetical protein
VRRFDLDGEGPAFFAKTAPEWLGVAQKPRSIPECYRYLDNDNIDQ